MGGSFSDAVCGRMESTLLGAQTGRRGGAGPVGGLLGGKDPTGRFVFRLVLKIEHVVVAGRGVVPEDPGEPVEVEVPQVVDPAADALAVAAARAPLAAVGVVPGDRAA